MNNSLKQPMDALFFRLNNINGLSYYLSLYLQNYRDIYNKFLDESEFDISRFFAGWLSLRYDTQ